MMIDEHLFAEIMILKNYKWICKKISYNKFLIRFFLSNQE
jgi:hypothetical protein